MANLSLNPIFDGLNPLFKQLKTVAMSACLTVPVVLSAQAKSSDNSDMQIFSVQKMKASQQDMLLFTQSVQNVIDLAQVTTALTDLAISFVPWTFDVIPTHDILVLEEKVKEYDELIVEMRQYHYAHPRFISALDNLANKIHYLCHLVKSKQYKQQSDNVVFSRVYQGDSSVGYSFNAEHSFEDFRNAMRG
ncbi:hypothetical protein CFY87_04250 [Actinobacillus seminis]|uniref:Uncharacterized protein n=1 Tax=Actinobacillus seminis TaxID=722 RepID=A0A263HEG7_9PAST|nr:hypothetical protein [Actinobacillus seminis]OZN25348.1 hypothetical protein CFY87_04250 [Actinobacillus seminis]SUU35700.1 Uncharacterised protein [Actinobacillus seminis]